MSDHASIFLTAEWRNLAILNYEIDPAVLRPFVPVGTELDQWSGKTYVSIVGFLFLNTRVLRVPIPFHRNFEEVNLRFYVRRTVGDEVRRGVVFIREFVPRRATAWTANVVYGENYLALPMAHSIRRDDRGGVLGAVYSWRRAGRDHRISIDVSGEPRETAENTLEEFITEHYWGYARRTGGATEYRVEHLRWRIWRANAARLECDASVLYPSDFCDTLSREPVSAFLVEGSAVSVSRGMKIDGMASDKAIASRYDRKEGAA